MLPVRPGMQTELSQVSGTDTQSRIELAQQMSPGSVSSGTVAVTGASGFIGSHVCNTLLVAGYTVRAIVRNTSDPDKTDHLKACAEAVGASDRLQLFQGDLLTPGDYDDAFAGADAVVHTAAVVAISGKNPEKRIVEPSIRGTENMLASADKSGTVQRIIHTSSVAAVQSYDRGPEYRFTEKDEATWSTVARGDPYGYAKLGAEKLVRDHCAGNKTFDCVSINPVVVFGPCLTKAHTKASPSFLRDFLYGNKKPDAWISVVDVRDVAQAHLLALRKQEAAGHRYIIAVDDSAARLSHLATATAEALPEYAIRPRMRPGWQVSLFFNWPWFCGALVAGGVGTVIAATWSKSVVPSTIAGVVGALFLALIYKCAPAPYLKKVLQTEVRFDAAKSRDELGLTYRPLKETLIATAQSMVERGWVQVRLRKADEAVAGDSDETQPLTATNTSA